MSTPTVRDVMSALEAAREQLPGFECVVVDDVLPGNAAAITARGRVYLAADQPAEDACRVLVDAVTHLLGAGREAGGRAGGQVVFPVVPQQRGPVDAGGSPAGRSAGGSN